MIESIDEQGNFTWHCDNPECTHHNCDVWKRWCETHHAQGLRVVGETHNHHISDEGVVWLDEQHVELPVCHCGQRHTVRVQWPIQAMQEPTIVRGIHPVTGRESILDAKLPSNLYQKITHLEKHVIGGQEQTIEIIDAVQKHPHFDAHVAFGEQLKASGRVFMLPQETP